MKKLLPIIVIAGLAGNAANLFAATPEQEKAFVASYKKALESGDKAALDGFLYTKGAEAEQIEFFKMMQQLDPGSTITKIELIKPTAEEAAEYSKPMEMPDGKKYKMPFKPTYVLVVEAATKSADGSSTSKSRRPVGEKDGKLCVPVPVPATAGVEKSSAAEKPATKEKPPAKPKAK